MSRKSVHDMNKLTRAELAKLLGVDASTISRHKKRGLPINEDGKTHPAPACVQWVIARVEQAASADAGETDESRKWLGLFRKERAKIAKIERLKMEGTLIAEDEIIEEWVAKARVYRSGLLAYSNRLPPLLTGKSQLEARGVLHRESCLLLAALSRDTTYCSAEALPEDYKDLQNLEIVKKPAKQKKTPKKKEKK
jgi:phage terminase Nu1 subunit (DNA packaging protein)